MINDKVYDAVKNGAMVVLPAAGALYAALATVWGWPNAENVVGSVAAVNVFLGVLAAVLKRKYDAAESKYDGSLEMSETDERQLFQLVLNGDPEELKRKDAVVFQVNRH